MDDYKTIKDVKLEGQRTFMRVDFNILDEDGNVGSTKRIIASFPSIKYALKQGAMLILASHIQRPGGKIVEKWRMAPVKDKLKKLLHQEKGFENQKVDIVNYCVGPKVEKAVNGMKKGDLLVLENFRFMGLEEADNATLAGALVKELAKFIDVYVLDGFAIAHRKNTSTAWLPLYLIKQGKEVAAGYLMKQELDYWSPIAEGEKGGVAIIGGAKLKEKMEAATKFPKIFDKVVVGGVVSNVFLRAKYGPKAIGSSLYFEKDKKTGENKDYTGRAQEALKKYSNIVLPTRVVLDDGSEFEVGEGNKAPAERSIVDTLLEESTLEAIRSSPRVVIFGTMGKEGYTKGTDQIVDVLQGYSAILRIGGGDAERFLKGKLDVKISTGGGASIEYIIKGTLPGLEALKGNFKYFEKV